VTGAEPAPVLEINDLAVRFSTAEGEVAAVKGINLIAMRGRTVAVVGESGSGKTQAMMAALGLLAANGRATGSVRLEGREILNLPQGELNRLRGRRISMIFQEPMSCLDPLFSVAAQIGEVLRIHGRQDRQQARERTLELLSLVGIDQPAQRLLSYPHELSGGQRQRVMIAMAIANNPAVLIADEPTSALDVTVQAQVLDLLGALQARLGMTIVLISHDLDLVSRFADRVYVMRAGALLESGSVAAVMRAPKHAYTKALVDARPSGHKAAVPKAAPVEFVAKDVRVSFLLRSTLFRQRLPIHAVDGISFTLRRGQTLGVVGESGSGKSTLGRAILKMVPSTGYLQFQDRDLTGLSRAALRPVRKSMQIVFQDPFGSLSPRMTVGDIVTEGLLVHEPRLSRLTREALAAQALIEVGLDPTSRNRFPHEFSGGQRQRIAIARAMILKPRLVVLDEPTSALDRTLQSGIVALLRQLQQTHGLTYLFISHDLAIVRALADEILVLQKGRIVEQAPTETIFSNPRSAYTRELIAAAYLLPTLNGSPL
jgi:ABC-type microcin C transport system duplicated ATPase subunit YejF